MIAKSRIRNSVLLRGSVRNFSKKSKSFNIQPIFGDRVQAFATSSILNALHSSLKEDPEQARFLFKGVGVFRSGELEYILQVDSVSRLHPLDVAAQLDDLRHLKDGWGDGIQHPSDWGNGYGKAPVHDELDWLAERFASEFPNDLPLPRIYPTPEGGVHMEWRLGRYDITLEVEFEQHTGEWNWVDLDSQQEGESALNMADTEDWTWLASELRRFSGVKD